MGSKPRRPVGGARKKAPSPKASAAWLRLLERRGKAAPELEPPALSWRTERMAEAECGCKGKWIRADLPDGKGYKERWWILEACNGHKPQVRGRWERLPKTEAEWPYPCPDCFGEFDDVHLWWCRWWDGPGKDKTPF